MQYKFLSWWYLEQTAERTRKEATGSGQYAGFVEDTEEQREVFIQILKIIY